MADLSQVRDTIAQNLNIPVYPNGLNNPSVAGVPVMIYSGWPIRTILDVQLQQGNAVVSVYPKNQERVVTKFQRIFSSNTLTPATLTVTVLNNTVTIGGTVSIPQSIMIISNGIGYGYAVQASDSLNSIASNMALLIPNATAFNNVITINNNYSLNAYVSSIYSASEELARVDRVFMISIWSPDENVRFLTGNAINDYMLQTYRMPMPDNFFAQVFYHSTDDFDDLDKSLIYRRDLLYTVQYAVTLTTNVMTIADPYAITSINN